MNRSNIHIVLFLVLGWCFSSTLLAESWITINSSVAGSEVMVDEDDGLPIKGKQICVSVDPGLHVIMINKSGYRPFVDTVTTKEGLNQVLNVWLEPQDTELSKHTTKFIRRVWDYQIANDKFDICWFSVGAGLGTGATMHASLFNMRYALLEIDPCVWGFNAPFYNDVSHVQTLWLVHPRNPRSEVGLYEMAIPSQGIQFFYTPMVGVHLPIFNSLAVVLSAGPQISWTKIVWSEEIRELPTSYGYAFTKKDFPKTGYQFDPVWFSLQIGCLFRGVNSDLLTYFRYQDGFFAGIEMRF